MSAEKSRIAVTAAGAGHVGAVIRALVGAGWVAIEAPKNGNLVRNRQLLVLRTPNHTTRLRLLVYKITESSRGRRHERRVEITSTYGSGLTPADGFNDVVLGFDPAAKVFVGLDPVRLRHGGPTSNASSFLEATGMNRSRESPFLIMLRQTRIFPTGEHQAFFRPERLGEYLMNVAAIHAGAYRVTGVDSDVSLGRAWFTQQIGSVQRQRAAGEVLVLDRSSELTRTGARLTDRALDELREETRNRRRPRDLTPGELCAIRQRQEENGNIGEQFVYDAEKRTLRAAGRGALANKVDWVSRRTVSAGYDIGSFDPQTGRPRFIEVKSSERACRTFDASANEWRVAEEHGDDYFFYTVMNVREKPQIGARLRNPHNLLKNGDLRCVASGWRFTIVKV
jgi:hypothetical protein